MLTSVKYFNKPQNKEFHLIREMSRDLLDDIPTIYKYNDKCCLVFGIRKLIYQEVQAKTGSGIRSSRSNINLTFFQFQHKHYQKE